jgi:hypothetical protein
MSKSLVQNQRIIAKKGTLNGREVLAFFAVAEGINGYSVRLVDFRYTDKAEVVALPTVKTKNAPISIQSPYFSSSEIITSDFSFLINQSPRAPNFA